jgi:small subunit ribosomal protein S13
MKSQCQELVKRGRGRWIRLSGCRVPSRKRIIVSLTYLFGIGKTTAKTILHELEPPISPDIKGCDLHFKQLKKLRKSVEELYKTEGRLRRQEFRIRSSLLALNSYRAKRHRVGLPVRGQRTRTNARTRKNSRCLSCNI